MNLKNKWLGSYVSSTSFYRSKIDNDIYIICVIEKRFKENQDKKIYQELGHIHYKIIFHKYSKGNVNLKNSDVLDNFSINKTKQYKK